MGIRGRTCTETVPSLALSHEAVQLAHPLHGSFGPAILPNNLFNFLAQGSNEFGMCSQGEEGMSKALIRYIMSNLR